MLSVQALAARNCGFAACIAVGPGRRWRRRLAALVAALSCTVVPGQASGCPTTGGSFSGPGKLAVQAQVWYLGGAARAPELGEQGVSNEIVSPAQGAMVVVLSPEAPPTVVAEQLVDTNGQAEFLLPAGPYTVSVTRGDLAPGLTFAIVGANSLPDGRPVLAQQEVALDAEAAQDVTLKIVVPLP